MKAKSPLILAPMIAALAWTVVVPEGVEAQTAPRPAAVPQTAAEVEQAPPKRSFFSRFRRQPSEAAPASPGASVPVQQAQAVPQAAGEEEKDGGFGLRFPRLRMPDLSRLPKPRLPEMNMPDLRMPKLRMPRLRWPFGGSEKVSGELVQEYPQGIANPRLGGAFGVVRDERVAFYEIGPNQPFGPDEILKEGTLVTILSNDHDWAQVSLDDGRSGYVGLDQVRLAAAREIPAAARGIRERQPAARPQADLVAESTAPAATYDPPALPGEEALPGASTAEASESPTPAQDSVAASAGDAGVQAVDSPEVLFDPILDPLEPTVDGARPFLSDPIPSIEEELRAIQEAKRQTEEQEAAEASEVESSADEGADEDADEADDEDSSEDDA